MKLLLYCTKAKPYLNDYRKMEGCNQFVIMNKPYNSLNDTIVAECDYDVEKFDFMSEQLYKDDVEKYNAEVGKLNAILKKSCLSACQMVHYLDTKALGTENPNGMIGYAIHIKNLHIFDKPELLFNFTTKKPKTYDTMACDSCTHFVSLNNCKKCSEYYDYQQVIKAPRNMMKVCEWNVNDKVLISIHPEQLCKILNGEKTIIVKKKVLKEMLKNER